MADPSPRLLGPGIAAVVTTAWFDGKAGLAELGRRMVRWRVGPLPWMLIVGAIVVKRREKIRTKMKPWHRPTPPRPTSTPI